MFVGDPIEKLITESEIELMKSINENYCDWKQSRQQSESEHWRWLFEHDIKKYLIKFGITESLLKTEFLNLITFDLKDYPMRKCVGIGYTHEINY